MDAPDKSTRPSDPMDAGLARMVGDIEYEARFTEGATGARTIDARVLDAMRSVRRHEFVPKHAQRYAYDNAPLAIGHGQTISQPFIVALMTDLLQTQSNHRVLEVGTGCGYQTAVLSRLVDKVYSVEIVPELAREAADRLTALGFPNAVTKQGNGYFGWTEHAPFDSIIVTAAAPFVPPELVNQLKPGGRLVIPVGEQGWSQSLAVIEKSADGILRRRDVLAVVFVPLVDAVSNLNE